MESNAHWLNFGATGLLTVAAAVRAFLHNVGVERSIKCRSLAEPCDLIVGTIALQI